eukprot:TRINITY_DN22173_c0_g1_i2.p1 TRINITY_DN22173_c0_g1~~TRINITY_DN22173_c0_g1_i2.p1  ORF type:complete len:165 (-),score=25.93 TRINITY_DN22173_c0_g1_i2:392-886(-)
MSCFVAIFRHFTKEGVKSKCSMKPDDCSPGPRYRELCDASPEDLQDYLAKLDMSIEEQRLSYLADRNALRSVGSSLKKNVYVSMEGCPTGSSSKRTCAGGKVGFAPYASSEKTLKPEADANAGCFEDKITQIASRGTSQSTDAGFQNTSCLDSGSSSHSCRSRW